jgi:hypothetical protein
MMDGMSRGFRAVDDLRSGSAKQQAAGSTPFGGPISRKAALFQESRGQPLPNFQQTGP